MPGRPGPTGGAFVKLRGVNRLSHPSTPRRAVPAARRRAGWVVACLWLLVALMPLRAWAAAQMTVAMADAPAGAVAAMAELPPCHAAEGHAEAGSAEGHSACSQCLFCAPVLATAMVAAAGLLPLGSPPPAARAGTAPEGAADPLFKPPRG